ncbi:hypothetical protein U1Q18_006248 [Sarracenia purpurea var. burkii]
MDEVEDRLLVIASLQSEDDLDLCDTIHEPTRARDCFRTPSGKSFESIFTEAANIRKSLLRLSDLSEYEKIAIRSVAIEEWRLLRNVSSSQENHESS